MRVRQVFMLCGVTVRRLLMVARRRALQWLASKFNFIVCCVRCENALRRSLQGWWGARRTARRDAYALHAAELSRWPTGPTILQKSLLKSVFYGRQALSRGRVGCQTRSGYHVDSPRRERDGIHFAILEPRLLY